MRTKRLAGCMLLLLTATLILSVCPVQAEKLSIFLYDKRSQGIDEASIARFEAAHPGVDVEVLWATGDYPTQVLTMFASGTMPDIVTRDVGHRVIAELWAAGAIIDLAPFVAANRDHFRGWFPGVLESAYIQGKLQVLPRPSLQAYVLWYNLDHFDAAGLPYPDGSWTWESFRQIGKRLTRDVNGDGRTDIFAYDKSWNYWQTFFRNNGGVAVDFRTNTTQIGSKQGIETFEYLRSLRYNDRILPTPEDNWGNSLTAFTAGKTAMLLGSGMTAASVQNMRVGIALEPFAPGSATRNTMITIQGWAISSQSKNPALAFELVKYLSDEATARDAVIQQGTMVVHREVNNELFSQSFHIRDYKKVYDAAMQQPTFYAYSGVQADPWNMIQKAVDESIELNAEPISSIMTKYIPQINRLLAGK